MTATTDIKPFASGGGANLTALATYLANTTLLSNGFSTGADPTAQDFNRIIRQASFMSAGLAALCVSQGVSVPDDGNLTNLVNELKAALGVVASINMTAAKGHVQFSAAYGGLVIQWGSGTASASGTTVTNLAQTFDMAFPTAAFVVTGSATDKANIVTGGYPSFTALSITTSGFTAVLDSLDIGGTNAFNQPAPFHYIAIGN